MTITGPQCRAARALAQLPLDHIARHSGVEAETISDFEAGRVDPGRDARHRIQQALEQGGAVFIADDKDGGAGVRLKFNRKDVRAVTRLEGEGGPVGYDDV